MPTVLLYALYIISAVMGVLLFLLGRRFKTILRAWLESLGIGLVTLALACMVFAPNAHEFEVLIFDYTGAMMIFGAPGGAIGALWAARRQGCLALVISGIAGFVLGGLFALALNGVLLMGLLGVSAGFDPSGESFQGYLMGGLFFLGGFAGMAVPWAIVGMVREKRT